MQIADALISRVQQWFGERGLTDAVVGFSGGIDSTCTAMLLDAAGIPVRLVVADCTRPQSSPIAGMAGANLLLDEYLKRGTAVQVAIPWVRGHVRKGDAYGGEFGDAVGDRAAVEASVPIVRVAAFYGEAARLRTHGKRPVVVGTANMSEAAFLGFWGKSSDAAQDFYPLSHLVKSEVYALARELGAPPEAMNAVPSGDLLFDDTDDHKMIGATYPQIEKIIQIAEWDRSDERLLKAMGEVDDLPTFLDNIHRNKFKYDLPFPGFHIDERLEHFRRFSYFSIMLMARQLSEEIEA